MMQASEAACLIGQAADRGENKCSLPARALGDAEPVRPIWAEADERTLSGEVMLMISGSRTTHR